ncbi:hypothetical protein KI659_18490 [Litoribacter alkaliphilus]|uniref:Helix-turn-helix domain-containing protein n=1 Tax=Litoribacter ruber TaxID=702568 RepID=A0AAP2CL92_9BACT|nr:hypothetical protein [Litoribacter alkaliphilus]MBS9526015.1 hypothetical protein [Litoribacter alkaliphilus]
MENSKIEDFDILMGKRLYGIMELLGLEVKGFAELVGQTESQVYSMFKGRRSLSNPTANRLGAEIGLPPEKIFNLNYRIPKKIQNSPEFRNFKNRFSNNPEYFKDTREDRKLSPFIIKHLIDEDFFISPRFVAEAVEACKQIGRDETSEKVTKALTYLVKQKVLKSKKVKKRLKDGTTGNRYINIYWR